MKGEGTELAQCFFGRPFSITRILSRVMGQARLRHHDASVRLLEKVKPNRADRREIAAKVTRLKTRLQAAGQQF